MDVKLEMSKIRRNSFPVKKIPEKVKQSKGWLSVGYWPNDYIDRARLVNKKVYLVRIFNVVIGELR